MEPSTRPNQEIVVRFDAQSVSAADAKRAVSQITKRLKAIGVAHVQVSELHGGKLKVSYYSTIEVSVIKDLLERQPNFGHTAFNATDNPLDIPFNRDHSKPYQLDVVLIQAYNG